MAFGSRKLKFSGPSGKLTSNGAEYRQVWHCTVTDPLDGPITVFNYFKANGPYIGSHYQNGNESDTGSFLDEIDVPQHIDGSATEYQVVCTYKPLSISGGSGKEQNRQSGLRRDRELSTPTTKPWRWNPELSVVFSPQQVPVYQAEYLSGFKGDLGDVITPGTMRMPCNSACVIFDPPLEKDDNRLTLRIKTHMLFFNVDLAKSTINCVNKFPVQFGIFTLDGLGRPKEGIYGNFAETTLKVSSIEAAYRLEHTADDEHEYYEVNIEIQWRDAGWHEFVLDRGISITVEEGRDNGRGGKFSMAPAKNAANSTPVQGMDGEPITEPVLLNGSGGTLPDWADPNYIEYKLYTEINYATDPFLSPYFKVSP